MLFAAIVKEAWHTFLIESLVNFGNFDLFIIHTANSGLISMDALPLAFKYEEKGRGAVGSLTLPLNGSATIPQETVGLVIKVIDDMNIVLEQIIPGLTISIKELGVQILKNNKSGSKIQLMSHKNSKEIPFAIRVGRNQENYFCPSAPHCDLQQGINYCSYRRIGFRYF